MCETNQKPFLGSAANSPAGSMPEPACADAFEVKQARVRVAALHGDPLSVQAAARAHRAAESRTLFGRLVRAARAMLRPARPAIRGERAKGTSVVGHNP